MLAVLGIRAATRTEHAQRCHAVPCHAVARIDNTESKCLEYRENFMSHSFLWTDSAPSSDFPTFGLKAKAR